MVVNCPFLYYVPYVTLSVITFPSMMDATGSKYSGMSALVGGLVLAWRGASLFKVAVAACAVVYVLELFIL